MKFFRLILLLCMATALFGCVLSPKNKDAAKSSDALLQSQLTSIENFASKLAPTEKLFVYVGSAQHSQSLAFQNDVLLGEAFFSKIEPKFKSIILSNEQNMDKLTYPFATIENLNLVFDKLSVLAQKNKLVLLLLITSHGYTDLLAVNIANNRYPAIRSVHLKNWLRKLPNNSSKTLILSACYSGSFIDPLKNDNAVIMTASASDRSSFGCQYHDKNTYFIASLLGDYFDSNKTWSENFSIAYKNVSKLENHVDVGKRVSDPQIFVPQIYRNLSVRQLLD